jgi:hypothetical protein
MPFTWHTLLHTPEGLAALFAGLQVLVLLLAALYAGRQLGETRRIREAETRPYVVVDLDVHQTIISLVISNLGRTMARDVRLDFDPPLETTFDTRRVGDRRLSESALLTDGVPTMAPGKSISTVLDYFPGRLSQGTLPMVYSVTVRYANDDRTRHYEDKITLDLGVFENLVHVNRYGIHEVHERLKEIQDELKKWTAPGGGLLATTPADVDQRHRELRQRWEAQQDAQDAAGAGASDPNTPPPER